MQDKKLEALCQTLTRESPSGTRWDYIAFHEGSGKRKEYYKSVVVQSSGAGQPMVVATPVAASNVVYAPSGQVVQTGYAAHAAGQQVY